MNKSRSCLPHWAWKAPQLSTPVHSLQVLFSTYCRTQFNYIFCRCMARITFLPVSNNIYSFSSDTSPEVLLLFIFLSIMYLEILPDSVHYPVPKPIPQFYICSKNTPFSATKPVLVGVQTEKQNP